MRLTTRYNNLTGKLQTKNYYYGLPDTSYPIQGDDGWFGKGKRFEKLKHTGFSILVKTFLDDIHGHLPDPESENLKQIQWQSKLMKEPGNAILIKEQGAHIVIALLFRGKPYPNTLFILENSLLVENID